MKIQSRKVKGTADYQSLLVSTILLAAVLLLASCPAKKGGSQSASGGSQATGQGNAPGQSQPPAGSTSPATLSRSIERELPLDSSFVIDSVQQLPGGNYAIEATSSQDTLQTSTLLISRLQQLGYETGDNPSRILEGASYSKPQGKVRELEVRVSLETDGSCRVYLQTR